MEKNVFELPSVEIIKIELEDVVRTSGLKVAEDGDWSAENAERF